MVRPLEPRYLLIAFLACNSCLFAFLSHVMQVLNFTLEFQATAKQTLRWLRKAFRPMNLSLIVFHFFSASNPGANEHALVDNPFDLLIDSLFDEFFIAFWSRAGVAVL